MFHSYAQSRAELVITHTMTFWPTLIGLKLSAWACQPFCCQRTFIPSPSECPGRPFYGRPFQSDRLAATPKEMARDLSGGTYPFALRELAFQLFFWLFELPTSKLQKIKNPASSAGHSHRSSGFARSSTNCYPVLVRRLTIGLFLVYFRPTVNSPDRSDEYYTPRTINEYTGFSWFVKPRNKYFCSPLCLPVQIPRGVGS